MRIHRYRSKCVIFPLTDCISMAREIASVPRLPGGALATTARALWWKIVMKECMNEWMNEWMHDWNVSIFRWNHRSCIGRVNGRISNRAEIRTNNYHLQFLIQFYQWSLKITLRLFTATLWMGWCWSWGSVAGIWTEIAFESWLFEFRPCPKFGCLSYTAGIGTYLTTSR